jgi:hypothetical protein
MWGRVFEHFLFGLVVASVVLFPFSIQHQLLLFQDDTRDYDRHMQPVWLIIALGVVNTAHFALLHWAWLRTGHGGFLVLNATMAVLATTLALPALVYAVQLDRSQQTPMDTQPWAVVSFATALFM